MSPPGHCPTTGLPPRSAGRRTPRSPGYPERSRVPAPKRRRARMRRGREPHRRDSASATSRRRCTLPHCEGRGRWPVRMPRAHQGRAASIVRRAGDRGRSKRRTALGRAPGRDPSRQAPARSSCLRVARCAPCSAAVGVVRRRTRSAHGPERTRDRSPRPPQAPATHAAGRAAPVS